MTLHTTETSINKSKILTIQRWLEEEQSKLVSPMENRLYLAQ